MKFNKFYPLVFISLVLKTIVTRLDQVLMKEVSLLLCIAHSQGAHCWLLSNMHNMSTTSLDFLGKSSLAFWMVRWLAMIRSMAASCQMVYALLSPFVCQCSCVLGLRERTLTSSLYTNQKLVSMIDCINCCSHTELGSCLLLASSPVFRCVWCSDGEWQESGQCTLQTKSWEPSEVERLLYSLDALCWKSPC